MRKQMIENAAYEVATQVRAVEDSIDSTLAEIAELQSRMMHANSVARVGPAPIHAALEQLSAAFGSLIAARGSIVACHGELVEAKGKVPGLRTVAFGDQGDCPPKTGHADLRVVA
jgi:DNA-binding FrmR family transcriptional regulator